jgi:hypothetical protein
MKLTKLQVKAAVNKLKREFKNMQNEDREKLEADYEYPKDVQDLIAELPTYYSIIEEMEQLRNKYRLGYCSNPEDVVNTKKTSDINELIASRYRVPDYDAFSDNLILSETDIDEAITKALAAARI